MINTTSGGDFQPQTGSKITCCSNNNDSRRIERYLLETRKHSSTHQPSVSEPISCPPSPPPDDKFYSDQSIEQSTEYYNERTWNMYYRIMQHCRKEDNKSSCASSCLSRRNDTCSNEKASRPGAEAEESVGNSNSGPEEIFQLEL